MDIGSATVLAQSTLIKHFKPLVSKHLIAAAERIAAIAVEHKDAIAIMREVRIVQHNDGPLSGPASRLAQELDRLQLML